METTYEDAMGNLIEVTKTGNSDEIYAAKEWLLEEIHKEEEAKGTVGPTSEIEFMINKQKYNGID